MVSIMPFFLDFISSVILICLSFNDFSLCFDTGITSLFSLVVMEAKLQIFSPGWRVQLHGLKKSIK